MTEKRFSTFKKNGELVTIPEGVLSPRSSVTLSKLRFQVAKTEDELIYDYDGRIYFTFRIKNISREQGDNEEDLDFGTYGVTLYQSDFFKDKEECKRRIVETKEIVDYINKLPPFLKYVGKETDDLPEGEVRFYLYAETHRDLDQTSDYVHFYVGVYNKNFFIGLPNCSEEALYNRDLLLKYYYHNTNNYKYYIDIMYKGDTGKCFFSTTNDVFWEEYTPTDPYNYFYDWTGTKHTIYTVIRTKRPSARNTSIDSTIYAYPNTQTVRTVRNLVYCKVRRIEEPIIKKRQIVVEMEIPEFYDKNKGDTVFTDNLNPKDNKMILRIEGDMIEGYLNKDFETKYEWDFEKSQSIVTVRLNSRRRKEDFKQFKINIYILPDPGYGALIETKEDIFYELIFN